MITDSCTLNALELTTMPVTLMESPAGTALTGLTENEQLYEIIDGQRVELPPMSAYASIVASLLGQMLGGFAASNRLAQVAVETLFRLPLQKSRNRRPDVAVVTYERWPKGRPIPFADNAWDVVPDLAVEVVSPHDLADEIMQKILEYFQAGVRLVWVVYPQQKLVYVYESPTQVYIRTSTDELDGGPVLPGLRLSLAELFPEMAPPPA
jgi:Uma2 family endonuclease